jgi:hypothetical protein
VKLLFDQNISFRAVKQIARQFPQAKQVRESQLENFSEKAYGNLQSSRIIQLSHLTQTFMIL